MTAKESRTVSSANATPSIYAPALEFYNPFRLAAGHAPITADDLQALDYASAESICLVAGIDAAGPDIANACGSWKGKSENIPGWLDKEKAAELRGRIMGASESFTLRVRARGVFVLKESEAFDDALGLAALFLIVATGHLQDFAHLLHEINALRAEAQNFPTQWPEIRDLLIDLFDPLAIRPIEGRKPEDLPQAGRCFERLARALQGVSSDPETANE